ncbi:hypothetical protein ACRWOO_29845 [Streptomyces sp. NEAU-PBA10]|uniref:Uncharacterized protein n=1 Tax=Streptomyces tremellae TaxID=1124239 RepID=A0ABP7DSA9_9ACTN
MSASESTNPETQARRARVRTVCRKLIETEAATLAITHDQYTDRFGFMPDLLLRALWSGLGEGNHLMTMHLQHEGELGEEPLFARLMVTDGTKVTAEDDLMRYVATASRTLELGAAVTVHTKNDDGSFLLRAWVVDGGRLEPLTWQEAFEMSSIYDGPVKDYADAFEPELHLHRVASVKLVGGK